MAGRGFVTLVGAGPGDPGLLTLAGREALEAADVVCFDRLVGESVLAMIPRSAERIDVGKRRGTHPVPQGDINSLLLEHARRGRRVVRLKGGDPYLFGRGAEEVEELIRNGIPFRVIPGVASALAAPAYAGIPVTHRDFSSSLHIITGHGKAGGAPEIPYPELVRLGGTLVFLMGLDTLPELCRGLLRAGMPASTPAALVENGTRNNQRRLVAAVGDIAARAEEEAIAPPAVLVVGAVCGLAERYDRAAGLPLRGRRMLAAGSRTTAGRLAGRLREYGCSVDEYAALSMEPIEQPPAFWDELGGFAWIVFTSPFGVETFFSQLKARRLDARAVAGARFAVVGGRTAGVLEGFGVIADFVPGTYCSGALGEGLAGVVREGETALLFRAKDASGELPDRLRERAIACRDVAAYAARPNQLDECFADSVRRGAYDAVTFTSASSVDAFSASLSADELRRTRAFCIGGMTAGAAERRGMRVATSPVADIDGLAAFIAETMGEHAP